MKDKYSDDTEVSDETVVRAPRERDEASNEASDDTVLRVPDALSEPAQVSDDTVPRQSHSVALPVDEPEPGPGPGSGQFGHRSQPSRTNTPRQLSSLDPERRIDAVPGRAPWERDPAPIRGVSAGASVIYGARSERMGDTRLGFDQITATVGPAPTQGQVGVRDGRSTLPSIEKRGRRMRILTLVGFGAVIVLAATGLWAIAMLAFA